MPKINSPRNRIRKGTEGLWDLSTKSIPKAPVSLSAVLVQKEQKQSTGPFQAVATFRKLEGASEACQFQVPWEGRGSILQGFPEQDISSKHFPGWNKNESCRT